MKDVDAEHEDYFNKTAEEEDEYVVASHPILLYKLIKQMNWFYQKVFQSSASNKGTCYNCTAYTNLKIWFQQILPFYGICNLV